MTDFERHVRKVGRCLGLEVIAAYSVNTNKWRLWVADPDLGIVQSEIFPPSQKARALKRFHEDVYRKRARLKHVRQGGVCALCCKKLGNLGECDHIKPRSKGRDDRLENLRIVCTPCHRRRHGG